MAPPPSILAILVVSARIDKMANPFVFRRIRSLKVKSTSDADQNDRQADPRNPFGKAKTAAKEVEIVPEQIDNLNLRQECNRPDANRCVNQLKSSDA